MPQHLLVANRGRQSVLACPVLSFEEHVARDLVRSAQARLDECVATPEEREARILDAIEELKVAARWSRKQADAERAMRAAELLGAFSA